jgi:phage shock protein E
MFSLIKKLFPPKKANLKQLYANGAMILDVRMPQEFDQGHIKGAINVPLQTLSKEIGLIKKKNQPVITCCMSGVRSAAAASLLAQHGIEAYNGGGWESLQSKIG